MTQTFLPAPLPPAARPALRVAEKLRQAGHEALLAGGCVRDLLLGQSPEDYDVATSAPPEAVMRLFSRTRHVGAQFGVVLVPSERRWIEVATFRTDGDYRDGRRPESVQFTDARHDALRRDFTINGMFLDPQTRAVIDYVGGTADLAARMVRAVGDPARRFGEDHLRLLRAVRFAARLGFDIERETRAAIERLADRIALVAPERVRDELEKMLAPATRASAFEWLLRTGLLMRLWPTSRWSSDGKNEAEAAEGENEAEASFSASSSIARARTLLAALPRSAPFVAAFAALVLEHSPSELARITRHLAFSNEQRDGVRWVVAQVPRWHDPARPALAELKQALAHPAWPALRGLLLAKYASDAGADERSSILAARVQSVPPDQIAPAPLVGGDDLLARNVPVGPVYKALLDELYTRQLNEDFQTRAAALAELDQRIRHL